MKLLRSCLLWLLVYAVGYVALAAAADLVLRRFFPPPGGRYAALVIAGLCVLLLAFLWQARRSHREHTPLTHLVTGTLLLAILIGATVGVTRKLSPSFGEALIAAAGSDDLETLQGLLEAGADVDSRGAGGGTALMFAPTQSIARLLVAHGADVNVADLGGRTPLMRAVLKGNKQLVELYLAAGVNLDASNEQGQTALDIAREKGHDELVSILLAARGRGASP